METRQLKERHTYVIRVVRDEDFDSRGTKDCQINSPVKGTKIIPTTCKKIKKSSLIVLASLLYLTHSPMT